MGYSRTSHYRQSNDYYSHYTEPQVYYYSSNSYYNHGKRSVPEYNEEELSRMIREVAHKQDQRKRLSEVEKQILDIFGDGLSVDTSKLLQCLILLHKLESTGKGEALVVSSSDVVKLQSMTFLQ